MSSPSPLFSPDWFQPGVGPFVPRGQKTIAEQIAEQQALGAAWLASPIGQQWSAAQESATAQSRKVADAAMDNAKRQLDATVKNLRLQGRIAEADLVLRQGEAKIARQRFEWEKEIKAQEMGLKQEELGLNRAKTYAEFASTPDRMFMMGDLQDALGRSGQGFGPRPYGSTGTPHMKTYEDFEAIAGPSGSLATGNGQAGMGAQPPNAAGAGADPRIKAATGVLKELGISDGQGHDANDQAALSAIQNIFQASKPGTLERMRPGQRAAFGAGLARLGYYAPDAIAQMRRNAPGQGASRAA